LARDDSEAFSAANFAFAVPVGAVLLVTDLEGDRVDLVDRGVFVFKCRILELVADIRLSNFVAVAFAFFTVAMLVEVVVGISYNAREQKNLK
jgi:hypothetical protein